MLVSMGTLTGGIYGKGTRCDQQESSAGDARGSPFMRGLASLSSYHEPSLYLSKRELARSVLSKQSDAEAEDEAQEQHGVEGLARPDHDGESAAQDGSENQSRTAWHAGRPAGPQRLQRLRVAAGSLLPAGKLLT